MKVCELLPAVNGFRPTLTAMFVEGRPSYEEWAAMLNQCERIYRSAAWWIGDLLNYGEAAYGETYVQAVSATGLAPQTLMNYKAVAKAIPPEKRVEKVSWSAHRVVAFLPPKEKEKVLRWAEEEARAGDPPTSLEVKRVVNELQVRKSLADPSLERPRLVQVLLTREECQALLDGFGPSWESARQKIEEALLQF